VSICVSASPANALGGAAGATGISGDIGFVGGVTTTTTFGGGGALREHAANAIATTTQHIIGTRIAFTPGPVAALCLRGWHRRIAPLTG